MGDLLSRLPDRFDHEGRIFPYLISGLFDPSDEIKTTVFEIIEALGELYEETNEKELREVRQFGFKQEWMIGGLIKDSELVLPFPIMHRPRLGARMIVRQYVRRYINGIGREVSDWIEDNAARASDLLLYSIIYSEEYMVQFMDKLFINMYRAILEQKSKKVCKNMPLCFKLMARYSLPKAYQILVI